MTGEDDELLPEGFKDDTPIVIHPSIVLKMGSWLYGNGYVDDGYYAQKGNCMALYFLYYQTVRHQGNVNVWLTQSFTMNSLGWTRKRVRETKDILLKMGLIAEDFQRETREKKTGRFQKGNFKSYTPVNFTWTPEKIELMEIEQSLNIPGDTISETIMLKNLLFEKYNYNTIETDLTYTFDEVLTGNVDMETNTFYFGDDGIFKALGSVDEDKDFEYTIPTNKLLEVMKFAFVNGG